MFFARKCNELYRIVLHTNTPCHHEFGHYDRCGFRIRLSSVDTNDAVGTTTGSDDNDMREGHGEEEGVFIVPSTTWTEAEV